VDDEYEQRLITRKGEQVGDRPVIWKAADLLFLIIAFCKNRFM
jgi:hypothetical protein